MAPQGPAVKDFGAQWGEFEELLASGILSEGLVASWRKFFSEEGFCAAPSSPEAEEDYLEHYAFVADVLRGATGASLLFKGLPDFAWTTSELVGPQSEPFPEYFAETTERIHSWMKYQPSGPLATFWGIAKE